MMTSISPASRKSAPAKSGGKAAKTKTVPPVAPERPANGDSARDLNDLAAGERAANFRHTRANRRTELNRPLQIIDRALPNDATGTR